MWQDSEGARGDLLGFARLCPAEDMHRWSEQFGVAPDVIDFRFYQFGQLIDSRRWKWLHAEASLHRGGSQSVDFDDIAGMRAHLMGWSQ
jgi:hypothetical protein